MTAVPTESTPAVAATDDERSERKLAFLLISPAVLLMIAVTAYPIAYAVWLSLQRYNLAAPDDTEFVGLSNYVTILTDGYWWTAFAVTLAITVVSVASSSYSAWRSHWSCTGPSSARAWCGPRSWCRTAS